MYNHAATASTSADSARTTFGHATRLT